MYVGTLMREEGKGGEEGEGRGGEGWDEGRDMLYLLWQ